MMFAAGFGTRMGNLTATRPKPLLKVAGTPLIDHTLNMVRAVNPLRIVVNTHYLADQIEHHLKDQNIDLSPELPDVLETGGGLKHALPLLGAGPVYTTNTDAIWAGPNPFSLALEHWDPDRMDALAVCISPENTVGHTGAGDFVLGSDGTIRRGPGLIYGGIQILKTEGLNDISDKVFSLNRLWDHMIRDRRFFGVAYPGKWCDVGSPQGIEQAETLLKAHHV
ncbi:nucleotidyltransferase family protein [Shimia sp.]|uniref:nucleotidyltransferase family protein n=1 Tax=Shimia sp. TaxID=1954381 RepID=UPI00329797C1